MTNHAPDSMKGPSPGIAIKNGKLYRFDKRGGVVVVKTWPEPQAWCRRDGGLDGAQWAACRPWLDLSACSEKHQPFCWTSVNEMDAFVAIPQEAVQAVVASSLDKRQWASLQLAARVPGGLALLQDAPLLGAALACAYFLKPVPVARPLRSARALLRHGRGMKTWRRVAAWLGFDGSSAFVRTLRRVHIEPSRPWTVEMMVGLRKAWADPVAKKRLLHAPDLDHDVMQL